MVSTENLLKLLHLYYILDFKIQAFGVPSTSQERNKASAHDEPKALVSFGISFSQMHTKTILTQTSLQLYSSAIAKVI